MNHKSYVEAWCAYYLRKDALLQRYYSKMYKLLENGRKGTAYLLFLKKEKLTNELDEGGRYFRTLSPEDREEWCRQDLLKRGVI